jgi:hypothetical protein
MYTVSRAIATGTCTCGSGGIAGFVGTIPTGCRECIHGFLTNLKMVLAYRLPCVRTIVLADPEEPVDFCHARNLRCGAIRVSVIRHEGAFKRNAPALSLTPHMHSALPG